MEKDARPQPPRELNRSWQPCSHRAQAEQADVPRAGCCYCRGCWLPRAAAWVSLHAASVQHARLGGASSPHCYSSLCVRTHADSCMSFMNGRSFGWLTAAREQTIDASRHTLRCALLAPKRDAQRTINPHPPFLSVPLCPTAVIFRLVTITGKHSPCSCSRIYE